MKVVSIWNYSKRSVASQNTEMSIREPNGAQLPAVTGRLVSQGLVAGAGRPIQFTGTGY